MAIVVFSFYCILVLFLNGLNFLMKTAIYWIKLCRIKQIE
jgi:hypothetical protein